MDKVKQAGLQLKWVVLVLLVLSPLIYFAVVYLQGPSILLHLPQGIFLTSGEASVAEKVVIYLIPAFTPIIYWFALFFIHKLAQQFSTGEVFTAPSIRWIQWVGILLLTADFVYMLQIAITGPILSSLGLTESFLIIELKLGVSIIGLFILLISRIMQIAADINEQQQLTI